MKEAFYEAMNGIYHRITVPDKVLVSKKSKFQKIEIVELGGHKALFLDGYMQLWTGDEFIYHEMLAHFPLNYHSDPEKVLVLGAGDGFLIRELLKYKCIKNIVLVEIDEKVVELCKEHFAEETGDSLKDKRVKVVIDDALDFAEECQERFDVVIMDLVAYESGAELYKEENISKFRKLMKEEGIFATHGDDVSYPNHTGLKLFAKLSGMFPESKMGVAYIPSFDSLWAFMVFSNHELEPEICERVKTSYYDPDRSYAPAPFLQDKLYRYKREGFEKYVETVFVAKKVKLSSTLKEILE